MRPYCVHPDCRKMIHLALNVERDDWIWVHYGTKTASCDAAGGAQVAEPSPEPGDER